MSAKNTNPKDAIGATKPPFSTVPMNVVAEVGTAMLEGAMKYGRHNYRSAGVRSSIYFDAAMRHLAAWWEGQNTDPDSGVHHITKAIAGLVVLRDAQMRGMVAQDDRPPTPEAAGYGDGEAPWMEACQQVVDELRERYPDPLPPHVRGDEPADPPTYHITARLPVRDPYGHVYDFQEATLGLEVRDRDHGLALMQSLAADQYPGRVVTLWYGLERVADWRFPPKDSEPAECDECDECDEQAGPDKSAKLAKCFECGCPVYPHGQVEYGGREFCSPSCADETAERERVYGEGRH